VISVGDAEGAVLEEAAVERTARLSCSIKGQRKEGGCVGSGRGLPSTVCEAAAIVERIDKTDKEGQVEGCGGALDRGEV